VFALPLGAFALYRVRAETKNAMRGAVRRISNLDIAMGDDQ
jgi:hypothetical protein